MKVQKSKLKKFRQILAKKAVLNEQMKEMLKQNRAEMEKLLKAEEKLWRELQDEHQLNLDEIGYRINTVKGVIEII